MPTAATKPKTAAVNGNTPAEPEPAPLYGDKPTFTYHPRDGSDPIIFPAHSTTLGEVWCSYAKRNLKYLEFLWEMDRRELSSADQIFWYVDRSGATEDMQRAVIRLEGEANNFFKAWVAGDENQQLPDIGLPPES